MKRLVKKAVPRPAREWLRRSKAASSLAGAVSLPLKRLLRRGASHDEIYGDDYFEMIDETSRSSAEVMAASILERFRPDSVIDVGCGTGALIARLQDLGVEVRGVEHASAALRYCHERGLEVEAVDLSDPEDAEKTLGRYDLAVCFEVGHQLPPALAEACVSFLCGHSDRAVFSADSGASDRLPLNPQPPSYWIGKFEAQGFGYDEALSEALREEWRERGTAPWFHRRPMAFRRRRSTP